MWVDQVLLGLMQLRRNVLLLIHLLIHGNLNMCRLLIEEVVLLRHVRLLLHPCVHEDAVLLELFLYAVLHLVLLQALQRSKEVVIVYSCELGK